jgi:hypothetical protein
MEDLFTENIKLNAVGRIIEAHAPTYSSDDGGKREYHALTRGWIVNELFRRVDPAGTCGRRSVAHSTRMW